MLTPARRLGTLALLLTAGLQIDASAQPQAAASPATGREVANRFFQAQDWTRAARAYAEIVETEPTNAQAHFRLGVALHGLGRYGEAIHELQTAVQHGTPPLLAWPRVLRAQARAGRPEDAFGTLTQLLEVGFANARGLESDPELVLLRADPRFKAAVERATRNATPCRHDPRFNEFDFWLGEWDVLAAGSAPNTTPARSVITKILENCVVLESWTAPGSTGQSFNIYDRSRNQWHQAWVDVTGALHSYWGSLQAGNMVYLGDLPPRPGTTERRVTRLTFFNLGSDKVRQFSEDSRDGGKTWSPNFDLVYTRHRPASPRP